MFQFLEQLWRNIGYAVAFMLCVLLATYLGVVSFRQMGEIRQMERLPRTKVVAAIEGEARLAGRVKLDEEERVLKTPGTETICVAFKYVVERIRHTSKGKRYDTISRSQLTVPFYLTDGSGSVRVKPSSNTEIQAPMVNRWERRGRRYTEYIIKQGDNITVTGYVAKFRDQFIVGFMDAGYYKPLITYKTEAELRKSLGLGSLFACWGAVFFFTMAIVVLCLWFHVHQLITYLMLAGMAMVASLLFFGLRLTYKDMDAGNQMMTRHKTAAVEEIRGIIKEAGFDWHGDFTTLGDFDDAAYTALDGDQKQRAREIRINLANETARHNKQLAGFPNTLLAMAWGFKSEPPIPLPAEDFKTYQARFNAFQPASLSNKFTYPTVIISLGLGVLLTWIGFRSVKVKRYIELLATTQVQGVVYGLNEVVGKATVPPRQNALRGPLSGKNVVFYDWAEKELRGSGKNAKWVTVYSEKKHLDFLIRDESGTIPVDVTNAEIVTRHYMDQKQTRRKEEERAIMVDDPIYCLGDATLDPNTGESLLIKKGPKEMPFIVSNYSEEEMLFKKANKGIFLLNLALGFIVLTALAFFGAKGSFAAIDYIASACVAIVYLLILTLMFMYNDIVFLYERVRRDWSNIDVALKKRADLLPMLQEVVQRFFSHEREVLEGVTKLREKYQGGVMINPMLLAEYMKQEKQFLEMFQGLTEKYPDLKGSEQASTMMNQLIVLENEIAFMREGYNNHVANYNKIIATFPDMLLARPAGFKPAEFFSGEKKIYRVPPINLDTEPEPSPA
jgi:hypothetical protein